MRRPALGLLCVAFALASRAAGAAPGENTRFELSYRAPSECPDETAFRIDVDDHVHDDSRAAGARLELAIDAQESGYRGVLVAFDGSGHQGSRRIIGKTCLEVAHALAFLTGLVIELGGRIEENEAPPAPALAPARPPPTPITRAAPRVSAPPIAARRLFVTAVVLADTRGGFAQSLRPTGELGVEVAGRPTAPWSPSARLLGFFGSSELNGGAGSASLRFAGARLELCPMRLGSASLFVRACAGAELAAVDARGRIEPAARHLTKLWASAEATARVQWFATPSFFAELGGGPVFPLVRTHYYFEPDDTLYVVPDVTARVALGIGLLFK